MHSFYYGCLDATELAQVQVATSCAFSVEGVQVGTGQVVGPVAFDFKPTSATAATMQKAVVGSAFMGLQSVGIKVVKSGVSVCCYWWNE